MSDHDRATVPARGQNPQEEETPFRKFVAIAQVHIYVAYVFSRPHDTDLYYSKSSLFMQ
jgi:hypothetical protein